MPAQHSVGEGGRGGEGCVCGRGVCGRRVRAEVYVWGVRERGEVRGVCVSE